MYLVGLTGGIATGKSTVSKMLSDLGCPIIDADLMARQVVEPGQPALEDVRKAFGNDVISPDGSLNREYLGSIVFADPVRLRLLNSITHPRIYRAMLYELFQHFIRGEQFVILDLPLLFETSKMTRYLTNIVVVHCDGVMQMERLKARNNFTDEEALQRIEAQIPIEQKCQKATDIIYNSGSITETREQVIELCKRLRLSKAHWKLRIALLVGSALVISGVYSLGIGIWTAIKWSNSY